MPMPKPHCLAASSAGKAASRPQLLIERQAFRAADVTQPPVDSPLHEMPESPPRIGRPAAHASRPSTVASSE